MMHRFVFLLALLASSASAATWGTRAFAFHGRIAASQGAFSLAHLICMQGTFNRLLMDTPPGQPTEVLEVEDVEVEVSCWGCPPAPKKAKKDGDGSSKDRALEITESQE